MFNTVLVGVDQRTRGRDAIALAQRLVHPSGKLILAHVHPEFIAHARGDNGEFVAVEQEAGVDLLRSVSEEIGGHVEIRYTGDERVGPGLHRMVQQTHAELLVLGSSDGGMKGRVLLRPQTRHAINGAPCAVAVAPTGYVDRSGPIRTLGVGYNGSIESRAALEVTRRLASELSATANVFEALPLPTYGVTADGWETSEEAIYDRCRVTSARLADETGLQATVSCGDVVDQIAFFSSIVDLLVVGSRDYGPLGRLVHGSTTQKLLRCAHSPILILTRATRTDGGEAELRDLAQLTSQGS